MLEERCDAFGFAYRDTLAVLGEARQELLGTHTKLINSESVASLAVRKELESSDRALKLQNESDQLRRRVSMLERQVAQLQESRSHSDESLVKLQGAVVHAMASRFRRDPRSKSATAGELSRDQIAAIMEAAESVRQRGYDGIDVASEAISEFRLLPIDEV